MTAPLPPTFKPIGAILQGVVAKAAERRGQPIHADVERAGAELTPALSDIFQLAEERALVQKRAIMAGLLIGASLDLSDNMRCLQELVVGRLWPGPWQEVDRETFNKALNMAREIKDLYAYRAELQGGNDA